MPSCPGRGQLSWRGLLRAPGLKFLPEKSLRNHFSVLKGSGLKGGGTYFHSNPENRMRQLQKLKFTGKEWSVAHLNWGLGVEGALLPWGSGWGGQTRFRFTRGSGMVQCKRSGVDLEKAGGRDTPPQSPEGK